MKHKKKKTVRDLDLHFQRRCSERVGTVLNQVILKQLLQEHKLILIGSQSNTRTLFRLPASEYKASRLSDDQTLVYDKQRHAFVTVVPYTTWKETHDAFGERL